MMLEHLGLAEEGSRLMRAVETVLETGTILTPDLGGAAPTDQVTDAVSAALGRA
jgi:tartrate dehydrogenase/decarboxylase/D-malate dehydrogenase